MGYAKYGKPHRRSFNGGVDVVVNLHRGYWVPSLQDAAQEGRLLNLGAPPASTPGRI